MHHPELPSAHSQPFLRLAWTTWPLQPERLRQVPRPGGPDAVVCTRVRARAPVSNDAPCASMCAAMCVRA